MGVIFSTGTCICHMKDFLQYGVLLYLEKKTKAYEDGRKKMGHGDSNMYRLFSMDISEQDDVLVNI